MRTRLCILLCLAAALITLVPWRSASHRPPAPDLEPTAASRSAEASGIVVTYHEGVDAAEITQLGASLGVNLHENSPFSREARLEVAEVGAARIDEVIAALRRDPRIASAEPDYIMTGLWNAEETVSLDRLRQTLPNARPNDPLYKFQWHMHKIDVEKAWLSTTGKGVVVAVIDTGVAYENHGRFHRVEDLAETAFVKGWDFVGKSEHANDDHGHGTHVAGTIAQTTNNAIGVVGVAPGVSIMPIKVLSARGTGKVSDIAEGIRFAANHGAKVINMSLGGPMATSVLESAVKHAYKKGVVIVCAAGNSNSENVGYPARYEGCVAVSATRFDDQLTFYTNRGKRIDIAAPGGDMNVDQNDDGYKDGVLQNTIGIMDPTTETYALFQGTSMAAPHVAGAAALLVAQGITKPSAVLARLQETARKEGLDLEKGYGAGVLDIGLATTRTKIADPMARLVLGLMLLGGMFRFSRVRPRVDLWVMGGIVVGGAGLFFLPWLGIHSPSLLTTPLPDWDLSITGLSTHANALLWSALLPSLVALGTFSWQRGRSFSIGLAIGVAAFLTHEMAVPTADVCGIGSAAAQQIWLFVNVAACLALTSVVTHLERRDAMTGAQDLTR